MNTKNTNPGNFKKKLPTILSYILIPLMIIGGITIYAQTQKSEKKRYYEIVSLFNEGKVSEYNLNLSSGALSYKIKGDENKVYTFTVPNVNLFVDDVHEDVINFNIDNPENKIKADYIAGSTGQWLYNIVPTLLLLVAMGGLTFFMFKRMNQTMTNENNRTLSFGKARIKQAKDEKRKTTFKDVAGLKEEKEEQLVFHKNDFFVDERENYTLHWIVPNTQKNEMEPILIELPQGGESFVMDPHSGEEFGYVLEGAVILMTGEDRHIVHKGETFYLSGKTRHYLKNEKKTTAKVLWVSTPPLF